MDGPDLFLDFRGFQAIYAYVRERFLLSFITSNKSCKLMYFSSPLVEYLPSDCRYLRLIFANNDK